MDVRSDTQREDRERARPTDNESGTGFQKDHVEMTGLVMRRDEDHRLRKLLRPVIPGKRKTGRPKTRC